MTKYVIVIAKTEMKDVAIESEGALSQQEIKDIVASNYPDYEVIDIIVLPS